MRVITYAGMSIKAFGEEYDFTRNRLTWQAQARFSAVSDSIVEALGKLLRSRGLTLEGVSEELFGRPLQQAYTQFRYAQRLKADLPTELSGWDGNEHPIRFLVREVGGVSTLSRKLCVHEFTLRRYWSGEGNALPEDIRQALRDTRWEWAESFISACDKHDANRK